jgi:hypothetical protein
MHAAKRHAGYKAKAAGHHERTTRCCCHKNADLAALQDTTGHICCCYSALAILARCALMIADSMLPPASDNAVMLMLSRSTR